MEHSPQIAVLIAAAQLAARKALVVAESDQSSSTVNILGKAISEIIHGLESDNDEHERENWSFKMHAIMFQKLLNTLQSQHETDPDNRCPTFFMGSSPVDQIGTFTEGRNYAVNSSRLSTAASAQRSQTTPQQPEDYLSPVCSILPDVIDTSVYFELVDQFTWTDLLAECLLWLRGRSGQQQVMFDAVIRYCTEHQAESADLLCLLLQTQIFSILHDTTGFQKDRLTGPSLTSTYNHVDPTEHCLSSSSGSRNQCLLYNLHYQEKVLMCIEQYLSYKEEAYMDNAGEMFTLLMLMITLATVLCYDCSIATETSYLTDLSTTFVASGLLQLFSPSKTSSVSEASVYKDLLTKLKSLKADVKFIDIILTELAKLDGPKYHIVVPNIRISDIDVAQVSDSASPLRKPLPSELCTPTLPPHAVTSCKSQNIPSPKLSLTPASNLQFASPVLRRDVSGSQIWSPCPALLSPMSPTKPVSPNVLYSKGHELSVPQIHASLVIPHILSPLWLDVIIHSLEHSAISSFIWELMTDWKDPLDCMWNHEDYELNLATIVKCLKSITDSIILQSNVVISSRGSERVPSESPLESPSQHKYLPEPEVIELKHKAEKLLNLVDPLVSAVEGGLYEIMSLVEEGVVMGEDPSRIQALPWDVVKDMIKQRTVTLKACMDHLLEPGCLYWLENDFFAVLETVKDQLIAEPWLDKLIILADEVERTQYENPPGICLIHEIWQVVLDVLCQVPLLYLDHLVSARCHHIINSETKVNFKYGHSDGIQTFLEPQITSVFNRMTGGDYKQVQKEFAGLCFINPVPVFQKAVNAAVFNKGQADLVINILRGLPSLCHVWLSNCDTKTDCDNTASEESLLSSCILSAMMTGCRKEKRANLLEFVLKAIQGYQYNTDSFRFSEAAILDIKQFSLTAIIPHLNVTNMLHDSQPITADLALDLLVAIVNASNRNKLSTDWLLPRNDEAQSVQPLALLLCLCEMLEALRMDDGDVTACSRLDSEKLKMTLLEAISVLQTVLDSNISSLPVSDLSWFEKSMLDSSLPGILRVRSLLPTFTSDKVENLVNRLVLEALTENKDSACGQLGQVLELCSVDEELNHMCVTLVWKSMSARRLSYKHILIALVQVLPSCVTSEWCLVVQFVEELLRTDVILTPDQDACTYQDVRVPVQLCQLLSAVLSLCLSEKHCPWVSQSMAQHTVHNYMAMIKKRCLPKPHGKDAPPLPSSIFLLSTVFCQMCHLLTIVTSQLGGQVCVLLLQVVKILCTEARTLDRDKDDYTDVLWKNHYEKMMKTLNQVPESESSEDILVIRGQLEKVFTQS